MNIGFDFDGVFSDCGQLKSEWAKKLHGLNIPAEKFKKELIIETGTLTLSQYGYLQKQIYETREIGLTMSPVEGAFEISSRLQMEGHNLSIITSRGESASEIAREWMRLKKSYIPIVGIGGGISKAEACKGLDVYMDDDMGKLIEIGEIVPNKYLFSWGYNSHIKLPESIGKRVESWQHFYKEISALNK
ncbi:hypothetical protein J4226_05395 [Candidatus Pacearchaeota archaeon]|nr:hypothetical protein [Candidatus Pacearchaeota archaeon]